MLSNMPDYNRPQYAYHSYQDASVEQDPEVRTFMHYSSTWLLFEQWHG